MVASILSIYLYILSHSAHKVYMNGSNVSNKRRRNVGSGLIFRLSLCRSFRYFFFFFGFDERDQANYSKQNLFCLQDRQIRFEKLIFIKDQK
jgi:hypothetical protein